jgi:hypothetical protein
MLVGAGASGLQLVWTVPAVLCFYRYFSDGHILLLILCLGLVGWVHWKVAMTYF